MTGDFDANVDDVDDITGWGADDFDEELLGRGRRRSSSFAAKTSTKRQPKKVVSTSSSTPALPTLQAKPKPPAAAVQAVHAKQPQDADEAPKQQHTRVERKAARKERQDVNKAAEQPSPRPSPRVSSLADGNAAIAALGRQRRMKVVAAQLANNVSRQPGLVSVVSASFDGSSDDEQDEPERASWPSSAPQHSSQQEHLPRVAEPSTAPAGPVEVIKKIHPPLPLPLLSIKPDCGASETRVLGNNNAPGPQAPRHWRRHRHKPPSLLASRYLSEDWETNFPPVPAAPKYQNAGTKSGAASPFSRGAPPPKQVYATTMRAKELLPSIHQDNVSTKDLHPAPIVELIRNTEVVKPHDGGVNTKVREGVDDDDESWTKSYNDPDSLASSMAGLIQALSTFAASGKSSKPPKYVKNRKRRAKLRQQPVQEEQLVQPPSLRLPRPGDTIDVTSSRAPIAREKEPHSSGGRHRKHRKTKRSTNDATPPQ